MNVSTYIYMFETVQQLPLSGKNAVLLNIGIAK